MEGPLRHVADYLTQLIYVLSCLYLYTMANEVGRIVVAAPHHGVDKGSMTRSLVVRGTR